jgi:hypothetical protein
MPAPRSCPHSATLTVITIGMFDDSYLVYKGGFLVLGLTINQFVLFNMSTKTLKRPYFGYNLFSSSLTNLLFASPGVTALYHVTFVN